MDVLGIGFVRERRRRRIWQAACQSAIPSVMRCTSALRTS